MIEDTKVFVCDADCGHRAPSSVVDSDRPTGLMGLDEDGKKAQGIMGTVDVPDGSGGFKPTPFYAHRAACLKKAIDNVLNDMLPANTASVAAAVSDIFGREDPRIQPDET